jgi:hypothetical protein
VVIALTADSHGDQLAIIIEILLMVSTSVLAASSYDNLCMMFPFQ